ncbi:MAG TPA: response regulator [Polyangiaceae bacterium]|nr:response regulator [Polyangiaceae bacterium]
MSKQAVQVLLIEDNEVDVEAVRRAFEAKKLENPIVVAHDGRAGIDALRAGRVRRPFVVLLDLNLPRMNGLEFLAELRADPELNDSVVFVLTTSKRDEDKVAAYRQQVAGYMVKSEIGEACTKLVDMLSAYWRIVQLPP